MVRGKAHRVAYEIIVASSSLSVSVCAVLPVGCVTERVASGLFPSCLTSHCNDCRWESCRGPEALGPCHCFGAALTHSSHPLLPSNAEQ